MLACMRFRCRVSANASIVAGPTCRGPQCASSAPASRFRCMIWHRVSFCGPCGAHGSARGSAQATPTRRRVRHTNHFVACIALTYLLNDWSVCDLRRVRLCSGGMADAAAAASKRPRSDSADDAGGSVGESSTAAAQAPAQSHAPTQEGGTGSGEAGAGAAGGGKKKPRLSKQEKKLLRMAARKEKWLQQKRAKKEAKAKLRQRQAEVAGVDAASLGQPKPIDESGCSRMLSP